MVVGIMSMQRIINIGSFLQAYGLKKIIEELGHEVIWIDYHAGKILKDNVSNNPENLSVLHKLNIGYIFKRNKKKKMYRAFNEYVNRFKNEYLRILGVDKEYRYNQKVDILVIGSDEVFNCLQSNSDVGYSKELFGYNHQSKKLISYAASFGTTTADELINYGIDREIGKMIESFDSISVRDANSFETVKRLTGIEPIISLDPVLIYDYTKEIPEKTDKKNYVMLYGYSERITDEEGRDIRAFAKKYNKKIISVGTFQDCCDEVIYCTPFEALAYFKNADYVITDTFHGTVFSIKFNKQFVTLIRESNKQKLGDLLNRLCLRDRHIDSTSEINTVINKNIDYNRVNQIIEKERLATKSYLKKNLTI